MERKTMKTPLDIAGVVILVFGLYHFILGVLFFILNLLTSRTSPQIGSVVFDAVLVVVGLCLRYKGKARVRHSEWLKIHGTKLFADYMPSISHSIWRYRMPRVHCSYSHNGVMYIFKSNFVRFLPQQQLAGQKITVYVSPTNMRDYYVDLSSLTADQVVVL